MNRVGIYELILKYGEEKCIIWFHYGKKGICVCACMYNCFMEEDKILYILNVVHLGSGINMWRVIFQFIHYYSIEIVIPTRYYFCDLKIVVKSG